jgi:hypothetical protein
MSYRIFVFRFGIFIIKAKKILGNKLESNIDAFSLFKFYKQNRNFLILRLINLKVWQLPYSR